MSAAAPNGMVRIPAVALPSMVGKPIHLAWAKGGCVWILTALEGDRIHVRTPKTGRRMTGNAADACYTRANQPRPQQVKP